MSAVVLTPNGTVATYGTVSVSAGTIHDALVSSGGEYVTLSNWYVPAPSYVLVDMSSFTLPPGGVIVSMTNTVYCGGQGTYLYAWRYGSNVRTPIQPVTASIGPLTSPDSDYAGVAPSTQADIDSYQLYIYNEPETTHVYVYQAFVTLTYIGLPSVTAQGPSGARGAASSQTVSWSFFKDSSSPGGQSKYQVRVFTAAQYGIGGFDPGSSPAWYDSGVVAGAATSLVVNNFLTNSYRSYVRAATTNSGADQWSPWSFTSFTIALKSLYFYRGPGYLNGPVKLWNGTVWRDAVNIKIWNGTSWINSVGG